MVQSPISEIDVNALKSLQPDVQPVAFTTIQINNSGWELVGLDFIGGIDSNVGQYVNHIRSRRAADAKYPQSPLNSRFLPAILSMSTSKTQFDEELDALFNENTPIPEFNANGRLSLEFVLPFAIGFGPGNMPTNSWTVIPSPVGNGIYQIQTTYPGHPDSGN